MIDHTEHDLHILTLTVAGEARGEDFMGMIAVAHVVLNRLASSVQWWKRERDTVPDHTIAAVCVDRAQFSCWNLGDPNLRYIAILPYSHDVYRRCQAAALCALTGEATDPTAGATHYYSPAQGVAPPSWARSLEEVVQIKGHKFFKRPAPE